MLAEQELKILIKQALKNLDLNQDIEINLEHPADNNHGDYASNIALILFKKQDKFKKPRELAEAILEQIPQSDFIAKQEIAGPGFINFYLSKQFLVGEMGLLIKDADQYLKTANKAQKIMVEFTDPNPFKEFHIGHLYSNTVGEAICRLLESTGAEVKRADYFGDVGMHVAKSVWGLLAKFEQDKLDINQLAEKSLISRIKYLGQAYALGATAYKENDQAQAEIKQLNFLIFKAAQQIVLPEFGDQPQINFDQFIKKSKYDYDHILEIYKLGRAWSLEYFENIYQRLGNDFDFYYPESRTGEYGYQMVLQGLEQGIFEKSDGAIIFPGEKHALHNRVFINSLGLPTYESKDLGNAVVKYQDFVYDKSLVITGNEINDYFKVILKALSLINPDLSQKTTHLGHGMVKLPGGKMSSRTGKIVTGINLLDEAKNRALKILAEHKLEVDEKERNQLAEQIGQAAVKYAFLKSNIGGDVIFDFDESLNLNGNSGPYLQYTYVRCHSVLVKSDFNITKYLDVLNSNKDIFEKYNIALDIDILRKLFIYKEVVNKAAVEYAPHLLCTYLFELGQSFNKFYDHSPILKAEPELREFRLALVYAVSLVLKTGLKILGIEVVNQM